MWHHSAASTGLSRLEVKPRVACCCGEAQRAQVGSEPLASHAHKALVRRRYALRPSSLGTGSTRAVVPGPLSWSKKKKDRTCSVTKIWICVSRRGLCVKVKIEGPRGTEAEPQNAAQTVVSGLVAFPSNSGDEIQHRRYQSGNIQKEQKLYNRRSTFGEPLG